MLRADAFQATRGSSMTLAFSGDVPVAWVFQGNPKIFDIDDYVARYPELIYWRTPRHQSQITIGDRAIIWRAGRDAGAIAIGTVVETPTPGTKVKHPEALGDDLWRAETPSPDELRTGIHLEEIRPTPAEGFLPRAIVMTDAALAGITLITMPNGTVFPLDTLQTQAIERLWRLSSSASTSIPNGAIEGSRILAPHFRRERSNSLRERKLAEVRALDGTCTCALCGMEETERYPSTFGRRIFEVHHLSPLSAAATPVRTTLSDLAVLCANCHRAVHATTEVEDNYAILAQHFRGES
jgi:hypothetical protein